METNDRITAILAHLRGGVAGIYTQKKLDELDKELRTQVSKLRMIDLAPILFYFLLSYRK